MLLHGGLKFRAEDVDESAAKIVAPKDLEVKSDDKEVSSPEDPPKIVSVEEEVQSADVDKIASEVELNPEIVAASPEIEVSSESSPEIGVLSAPINIEEMKLPIDEKPQIESIESVESEVVEISPPQKELEVRECSRLTKDVGNATSDTEVFFEYAINESVLARDKDLKFLPFQVL